MNSRQKNFFELCNDLAIMIPRLGLPHSSVDLSVWPVIACDQYTSQPAYWQETAALVGGKPSTLELILPELYLETPGDVPLPDRINRVNDAMARYLKTGIILEKEPGCVILDRSTPLHASRKGLVLAIDLEHYDFTPGNKELIRATEGTVLERIPPRQAIRRNALLELPHVQLLIDDPDYSVIEPLWQSAAKNPPLYDTSLIQGGGHVSGWFVSQDDPALHQAIEAMSKLKTLQQDNLLFAVGDGNHSLATARAHWLEIKDQVSFDHPARYALVEIINIHDQGLEFEPIHRMVFDIKPEDFVEQAAAWCDHKRSTHKLHGELVTHDLPVVLADNITFLGLPVMAGELVTAVVQSMLDELLSDWHEQGIKARIDYIHGEGTVKELAAGGAVGLILPPFAKDSFFRTISRDGILPRKTFSMGEAFEKRYYFESRRIKQVN